MHDLAPSIKLKYLCTSDFVSSVSVVSSDFLLLTKLDNQDGVIRSFTFPNRDYNRTRICFGNFDCLVIVFQLKKIKLKLKRCIPHEQNNENKGSND